MKTTNQTPKVKWPMVTVWVIIASGSVVLFFCVALEVIFGIAKLVSSI